MGKLFISKNSEKFEIDLDHSISILKNLKNNKIPIKASCGGHASCSECLIKILDGEQNLNEMNFEEKKLLGNVFFITKERLACQTICDKNDLTIEINS